MAENLQEVFKSAERGDERALHHLLTYLEIGDTVGRGARADVVTEESTVVVGLDNWLRAHYAEVMATTGAYYSDPTKRPQ